MVNKKNFILISIILILALTLVACGSNKASITENEAKNIATEKFNLTSDEVNFTKVKKEHDDGIEKYEIEFKTDNGKFEVEVNAETGEIIKFEEALVENITIEEDNIISEEEAKDIVLDKVEGASESDISKFKLEKDDSILKYEGEIRYEGKEYDFEINAETGEVIEWSEDIID